MTEESFSLTLILTSLPCLFFMQLPWLLNCSIKLLYALFSCFVLIISTSDRHRSENQVAGGQYIIFTELLLSQSLDKPVQKLDAIFRNKSFYLLEIGNYFFFLRKLKKIQLLSRKRMFPEMK